MKQIAFLSLLVLLVALPGAAQTTASGNFNYKGSEGLQTIVFDATGDQRSATGAFTLSGPTLVTDGDPSQEDAKTTLVPDFTMKVTVDCMSVFDTRVTMGGTISDSNVRSMIGRLATLTVQDNALNKEDPIDTFSFGSYWEQDISWFPTDAEVPGDAGWKMSWWATDAERKDDVGYQISRQRHVDCHSFPVTAHDLDHITEGSITVR